MQEIEKHILHLMMNQRQLKSQKRKKKKRSRKKRSRKKRKSLVGEN